MESQKTIVVFEGGRQRLSIFQSTASECTGRLLVKVISDRSISSTMVNLRQDLEDRGESVMSRE